MTKHICSTLSFVGLLALASAGRAQVQTSPVLGEFVKAWQVCGPFDAQSVLDPIVPDEDLLAPVRDGKTAGHEWKVLKSKTDQVDLAAPEAFGPRNNAVIFAYAEIQSEKDGDVILGLGSDDSAMAWWNGRQVLVQDVLRGLTVGQDQVNLKMRKGKNTLLLKIYNAAGGWGFAADLRPASGEKWKWQVVLPMTDDEFMDLVERKSFDYFWKEADPDTGLIPDAVCAGDANYHIPCSVASLGFGLSAICIGDSRGWVTRDESRARVIKALKSVLDNADQEHGMLYHFLDPKTGKRAWKSEVSSIDTALFLAGALTCKGYFHDAEIGDLVDKLYQRVDWKWFMDGTEYVKMSWTPESGFGPNVWMEYNELMVIYLLGIGAPSNALPAASWTAWKRPYYEYEGMTYVQAVPLFLHQYSHCWVDFRGKRDAWADYFKNSQLATKAHRQFCLGLKDKFPWYSENLWGVTASCAPTNYMVWGGPPETTEYRLDGTVVPCAAGGEGKSGGGAPGRIEKLRWKV